MRKKISLVSIGKDMWVKGVNASVNKHKIYCQPFDRCLNWILIHKHYHCPITNRIADAERKKKKEKNEIFHFKWNILIDNNRIAWIHAWPSTFCHVYHAVHRSFKSTFNSCPGTVHAFLSTVKNVMNFILYALWYAIQRLLLPLPLVLVQLLHHQNTLNHNT